jgi:hypothetical protein
MARLRALLQSGDGRADTRVVSAVHGLGGVGKTTLVAKLARDLDADRIFADGIYWLPLGEELADAEILLKLGSLIAYFGDREYQPRRVDEASSHLKGMLESREALIILDDAWDVGHARPFLVGGPRCRVVVTTRDTLIADEAHAELVDLDVMSDAEALALMTGRLRRALAPDEEPSARELAEAVGHLPLALDLAAARIAGGVSWSALFEDLRHKPSRLDALEDPRRLRRLDKTGRRKNSIRAAFNLSVRRLPDDDREKFAWLGVLQEETPLSATMVTTLWGMAEGDAGDLLRSLREQALLSLGPPRPDGAQTFRLHDLMRAIAVKLLTDPTVPPTADDLQGLGLTRTEAHNRFLDRYRRAVPEASWHTIPDDGYLHDHLVWHLEQADRVEDVHRLFEQEDDEGQSGWFRAREARGADAGFIADLFLAWELADRAWRLAEATDSAPSIVTRQCRYALILSSLNSLAGNIPPKLLVGLVEIGRWPFERALAYSYRVPDPFRRVQTMVALLPMMSEASLKWDVTTAAMAAARDIGKEWDRARALAALAPHLDADGHRDALATARGIEFDPYRVHALVALAPYSGEDECRAILAAAREIFDGDSLARALAPLVPHLGGDGRREALAVARGIEEKSGRAHALSALVPYLAPDDRRGALAEALAAVSGMSDGRLAARMVAAMAPYLRGDEYGEALAAARGIKSPESRAEALSALAPYLGADDRHAAVADALAAARAVKYDPRRASALAVVAPHLEADERRTALAEALAAARATEDGPALMPEASLAWKLAALAPALGADDRHAILAEALSAARRIKDDLDRTYALAILAPHLGEDERRGAVAVALSAARGVDEEWPRAHALALAARLHAEDCPGVLVEALEIARGIRDDANRTHALAALAPRLRADERQQALAVARGIGNHDSRSKALVALAPHLGDDARRQALTEALAAIRGVESAWSRAQALLELAPHLGEGDRQAELAEALAIVRAITDVPSRVTSLAALLPHLGEDDRRAALSEALAVTRTVKDDRHRAEAIAKLARHLSAEESREALALARGIENVADRFNALVALAPNLSTDERREVLAAARGLGADSDRPRALAALAPHMGEDDRRAALAEALAAVSDLWMVSERASVLAGLAPHLSEEQRREALAAARGFGDVRSRVEALTALAPHLGADERVGALAEALAATLPERRYASRTVLLTALARELGALDRGSLHQLWSEALHKVAAETRANLCDDLSTLKDVILALGGPEAARGVARAILDVGRWWP